MAWPLNTRKPTIVEWWVFKWIFIPLLSAGLLIALVSQSANLRKCKKACVAAGYEYRHYTPPNRAGVGEKCSCVAVGGNERSKEGNWIEISF
jgi:hypothetical protein